MIEEAIQVIQERTAEIGKNIEKAEVDQNQTTRRVTVNTNTTELSPLTYQIF